MPTKSSSTNAGNPVGRRSYIRMMKETEPISDAESRSRNDGRRRELIVEVVCDCVPRLEVVYLFGSQAKGGVHRESDIDVAILSVEPLSPEVRRELQELLSVRLRSDVDVVDLNAASTVMRMQVVTTGSVLFEKDPNVRHRYEMQTLSAYAHLNEERAALLEHVHRRGRIYGR